MPAHRTPSQLPAALGYRMPAEWEPHEATWIAWPHNRSDWPGKFEAIPWIYAEIIRHLARVERVNILVENETAEAKARAILVAAHVLPENAGDPGKPAGNIQFFSLRTNRVWTRDSGPIFVRRDSRKAAGFPAVAATAWRFNAWAKYNDWKLDAAVSTQIAEWLQMPVWQPTVSVNGKPRRVVLEGGSIDVNGRGTLITTEECLLSEVQQRNPGVTREQLEQLFADYLALRKSSGWSAASPATTPTATSTTSLASLRRTPWSPLMNPIAAIPTTSRCATISAASSRAPTNRASRCTW